METQNTTGTVLLTLEEVALMTNVIYTCSRRGAFEPSEFKILGALFERLKSELPIQEEGSSDEEEAPTTVDAVNSGETNTIAVDFTSAKA